MGPALKEFLKVAGQAQRVPTLLAVTQGKQAVVLSFENNHHWTYCHDSEGNSYHIPSQTPTSSANLWATMATKWQGATPGLASLKVTGTKAPLANKELKQLALRACCELFGIEPPSAEDLKKAASSPLVTVP